MFSLQGLFGVFWVARTAGEGGSVLLCQEGLTLNSQRIAQVGAIVAS